MARAQGKHREFGINWSVANLMTKVQLLTVQFTALFTKLPASWLPSHSRVCQVLFLKIPIAMNGPSA